MWLSKNGFFPSFLYAGHHLSWAPSSCSWFSNQYNKRDFDSMMYRTQHASWSIGFPADICFLVWHPNCGGIWDRYLKRKKRSVMYWQQLQKNLMERYKFNIECFWVRYLHSSAWKHNTLGLVSCTLNLNWQVFAVFLWFSPKERRVTAFTTRHPWRSPTPSPVYMA